MLERALLAVALVALGWLGYRGLNWMLLRQRARAILGIDRYQPGRPAILYFTTPGCVPCHTVQRPALREVEARYGSALQVIMVDASIETDLADRWGVLSVPTTFIIDAHGRARGVNHGVARAPKLIRQLEEIGAPPAAQGDATDPLPRYLD